MRMGLATILSGFLFLGWLQAVFSFVEPPTNVTLHCRNMHHVLKWSYKRLAPGMRFRVSIGYTDAEDWNPNEIWVNSTAELQADVSFLSDPESEYCLYLTAVIGQNESAEDEGLSFSYARTAIVDQICHLDFPSVNVTTKHEDSVTFRFTHPSLVYLHNLPNNPNKKKKKRSNNLPDFQYDVVILNQTETVHSFNCKQSVCEETIPVDAAQKKHCLKMMGELGKISVLPQEYCVLPREEEASYLVTIFVVGSLLALIVLCLIFYMVYRKRTTPDSALPKSVMIPNSLRQVHAEVPQETCIVPEVEPQSPTPLLWAEEKEFTTFVLPATESELRLPIGLPTGDEGVSDGEDGAINKEPEYMGGRHLEQDDVPCSSGYEKRSVLVELTPGELTEGYRD